MGLLTVLVLGAVLVAGQSGSVPACTVAQMDADGCEATKRALLAQVFEAAQENAGQVQWQTLVAAQTTSVMPVDGLQEFFMRLGTFRTMDMECWTNELTFNVVVPSQKCDPAKFMRLIDLEDAVQRIPLSEQDISASVPERDRLQSRVKIVSYRWILRHMESCLEQCLTESTCQRVFSDAIESTRGKLFAVFATLHPYSWGQPETLTQLTRLLQVTCTGSPHPSEMCIQEIGTKWLAESDKSSPSRQVITLLMSIPIPSNTSTSMEWFAGVMAASRNTTLSLPPTTGFRNVAAQILELKMAILVGSPIDRLGWKLMTPEQAKVLEDQAQKCVLACRWKHFAALAAKDTMRLQLEMSFKISMWLRLICESKGCISAMQKTQASLLQAHGAKIVLVRMGANVESSLGTQSVIMNVVPTDTLLMILAITTDGIGLLAAAAVIFLIVLRKETRFLKLILLVSAVVASFSALRISYHILMRYSVQQRVLTLTSGTHAPFIRFTVLVFWTDFVALLALFFVTQIFLVQWATAFSQLIGKEWERRVAIAGFGYFLVVAVALISVSIWVTLEFAKELSPRGFAQYPKMDIMLLCAIGLAFLSTLSTMALQVRLVFLLRQKDRSKDASGVLWLVFLLGMVICGLVIRFSRTFLDGLVLQSKLAYIDVTLGQALIAWSLCVLCLLAARAHLKRVGKAGKNKTTSDRDIPLLERSDEIASQYDV